MLRLLTTGYGPGCVKKASYRHRAQKTAGILMLNAIFLESIGRAPVMLPRASVGVHLNAPVPGSSSQGLQHPSHADDRHHALYVVGEHIERHLG
jgi:hypothetical protein